MKMAENSGKLHIVGDGSIVYDDCPPGFYKLWFDQREGHFLTRLPQIQKTTEVFGPMCGKESKIMAAYERRNGNTGVILEGPAGLGKSLLARRIVALGLARGLPTIVVGKVEHAADYIEAFTQPAIWLFDEFEKNYRNGQNGGPDEQAQFLSVLDGVTSNKRLFIITCNQGNQLNNYFRDRPGRVFYRLVFDFPDVQVITQYLSAQGIPSTHPCFQEIKTSAGMARFNFDALHAISEELLAGSSLSEALRDLNISTSGGGGVMDIKLFFHGEEFSVNGGSGAFFSENGVILHNRSFRSKSGMHVYVNCLSIKRLEYVDPTTFLGKDISIDGRWAKPEEGSPFEPPHDQTVSEDYDLCDPCILTPPERVIVSIVQENKDNDILNVFKWAEKAPEKQP